MQFPMAVEASAPPQDKNNSALRKNARLVIKSQSRSVSDPLGQDITTLRSSHLSMDTRTMARFVRDLPSSACGVTATFSHKVRETQPLASPIPNQLDPAPFVVAWSCPRLSAFDAASVAREENEKSCSPHPKIGLTPTPPTCLEDHGIPPELAGCHMVGSSDEVCR